MNLAFCFQPAAYHIRSSFELAFRLTVGFFHNPNECRRHAQRSASFQNRSLINSHLVFHLQLYSSAFRRTAAIVRNRSHIFDGFHFQACSLQSADGSFTASAGSLYEYFDPFQAMFHSGFGSGFSSHLSCERSAFPGTAEALTAGRSPAQDSPVQVGNRYDRVIKGGADMCYTSFNVLAYFPFVTDNFLPATRLIPP